MMTQIFQIFCYFEEDTVEIQLLLPSAKAKLAPSISDTHFHTDLIPEQKPSCKGFLFLHPLLRMEHAHNAIRQPSNHRIKESGSPD